MAIPTFPHPTAFFPPTGARKRAEQCKELASSFNSATASVEERQEYAECVAILHPRASGNTDVLLVGVAGLFIVFPIFIWLMNRMARARYDRR